jgi:hypothetical protein
LLLALSRHRGRVAGPPLIVAKRYPQAAPIRPATSAGATRYDTFISYSHALDGTLTPALQRGLERFAKPW